jgi:hypothetical protein
VKMPLRREDYAVEPAAAKNLEEAISPRI